MKKLIIIFMFVSASIYGQEVPNPGVQDWWCSSGHHYYVIDYADRSLKMWFTETAFDLSEIAGKEPEDIWIMDEETTREIILDANQRKNQ